MEKDEEDGALPVQSRVILVQPTRMLTRRALQDEFEPEEEVDKEITEGFQNLIEIGYGWQIVE